MWPILMDRRSGGPALDLIRATHRQNYGSTRIVSPSGSLVSQMSPILFLEFILPSSHMRTISIPGEVIPSVLHSRASA